MYTAQYEEDIWLDQNWEQLKLPEHGFFVEFGAGDGKTISNTYWLEKTKGWHGLLIEADVRHEIQDRPNSIIEMGLVVGPDQLVLFGVTDDPYLSGIYRTDTTGPVIARKRVEMQSSTLSSILDKHKIKKVDFISIDTEGSELEAWKTLDLNRWRPKVAMIELYTLGLGDNTKEVFAQMEKDGYTLKHQTGNGIFMDNKS